MPSKAHISFDTVSLSDSVIKYGGEMTTEQHTQMYVKTKLKEEKKKEVKRSDSNQTMTVLLAFFMYAGAARLMLTFDNKRKYIKIAQVQELVLHTIPIGALIWYNNTTDIQYSEEVDLAVKITFIASLSLTLAETVYFYVSKV